MIVAYRELRKITMCWVLLLVLLASAFTEFANTAYAAEEGAAIPKVIEQTAPTVVAIIGNPVDSKSGRESGRFNLAHGTGVIVRSDGVIVTNAHVVKDMRNIVIVTSDGKSYPGKTTHFDEESDLALVKIDAAGLKPAVFASKSDIKVGETVMAIGTPISFALRNSVTVGIVSGMQRAISSSYELIQTDAAINPGNSGGALVNMKGEVIGINTMKFASYGVDNLGFAIPVDTVQYVLKHFFEYGKVKRPYLGVELEESWEAVVGLPAKESLTVTYVEPDSPAAKAGIKQDDILLAIGSYNVTTNVEYNEALKNFLPDQSATIKLKSGASIVTRELKLGEDPKQPVWKQEADGSYIDSDQGKTKIGDSRQGWSMKYPPGLTQTKQSNEGDSVTLADAKGGFAVSIAIEDRQSGDLSVSGLLEKLGTEADMTVLERRYVEAAQPYAKIVGTMSDHSYYQARAYLHDEKIYYVVLYVDSGEKGIGNGKQNSMTDLLDGFKLSFDKNDKSLKDISVMNDDHTVTNDYGLTYKLPSSWSTSDILGGDTYHSPDFKQVVSVEVTSASSGDTLKDWVKRQIQLFESSYVEAYRETGDVNGITVAGVPGSEVRLSSAMGDKWRSKHIISFIKDKYKYAIMVDFQKDENRADIDKLIAMIKESASIQKDDIHPSLSFIQDIDDLKDPGKTVAFNNQKYMYTLQVPETWSTRDAYQLGNKKDKPKVSFTFLGGTFTVEAVEKTDNTEVLKKLENGHKKSAGNDEEYKYDISDEMVLGVPAKKVEVIYPTKTAPYHQAEYIFTTGGLTYTITIKMNDAVRTDANLKRMNDAIDSFKLEKPF